MSGIDEVRRRNEQLDVALDAVRRAATTHREYEYSGADLKSPQQLVTEADVAIEQQVKERISDRFPDHAFVGEEEGPVGDANHVWHVDPIDGTTDFVFDLPHSSVSIALVVDGTREVGVIAHPRSGTVYAAARGEGAFRDGEPISVADETEPKRSLFGVGFSRRDVDNERMQAAFEYFIGNTLGIRRYGSSALSQCYVADGTLHGFVHCNLGTWDVAAGSLVVEEAGGVVRDFDGESGDDVALSGDIVTTNPALYEQLPFVP